MSITDKNIFLSKSPFILDGATGTELMKAGMPAGVCPEQWVADNPDALIKLQRAYVEAGSDAVLASTFTANRAKLGEYGLGDKVAELNKRLVAISKEAVGDRAYVGGELGTTALFIPPYGDTPFEDIIDIYREQGEALVSAGADFLCFSTMMSLWECRAGLLAVRDFGLPVIASITVDSSGRTMMGASLPSTVVTLQALGASAVGVNCCEGPDGLDELLLKAAECARIPLIAKPNSGKPDPEHPGHFSLSVSEFAEKMKKLTDAGASVIGGCCGSTPEHIRAISGLVPVPCDHTHNGEICANEGNVFFLPEEWSGLTLSEPIACSYSLEDDIIDLEDERVNVAVVRVETEDDVVLLSETVPMARLPIMIQCDDAVLLDKALLHFHGIAMTDRRSELGEDVLREISARYGAVCY